MQTCKAGLSLGHAREGIRIRTRVSQEGREMCTATSLMIHVGVGIRLAKILQARHAIGNEGERTTARFTRVRSGIQEVCHEVSFDTLAAHPSVQRRSKGSCGGKSAKAPIHLARIHPHLPSSRGCRGLRGQTDGERMLLGGTRAILRSKIVRSVGAFNNFFRPVMTM